MRKHSQLYKFYNLSNCKSSCCEFSQTDLKLCTILLETWSSFKLFCQVWNWLTRWISHLDHVELPSFYSHLKPTQIVSDSFWGYLDRIQSNGNYNSDTANGLLLLLDSWYLTYHLNQWCIADKVRSLEHRQHEIVRWKMRLFFNLASLVL